MALIKEKVPRKVRKKGTITQRGHVGATTQPGNEERLASYVKRTLELKRLGHPYYEIADMIAQEYNLQTVPHITTVHGWRTKGMEAITEDIKSLQSGLRIDQFNELEKMKQKWLPLATAQSLEITRWVRVEGELQPSLDEDAVEEQIKATQEVVKIMNRQAKLMGLDLEKSIAENGDGPSSLQDLQIWMIGQLSINPIQEPKTIEAEVLELKSGIPEIDDNRI